MKKPSKLASSLKSWNTFLVVVLILEFVVFGIANSKFLRIQLLPHKYQRLYLHLPDQPVCHLCHDHRRHRHPGGFHCGPHLHCHWRVLAGFWPQHLGGRAAGRGHCGFVRRAQRLLWPTAACRPWWLPWAANSLYAGLALWCSTLSSTESYQGISGFLDSFKAITSFAVRRHPVAGTDLPGHDGDCLAAFAQIGNTAARCSWWA